MKRPVPTSTSIVLLILFGILLAILGQRLDGFLGGMAQGAGVGFVLVGAWSFGAMWRHGQDRDEPTWLPSRDER
ncbi:hypothetical protein [Nocardioides solisilvae]|uniref:hypothetical protein n=1 Tax=Nocardioides solisilvae TaxID=1542435 RepID=UPI000D744CEF|nr:hypothetical protein [Nocardioides solisilvae]